MSKLIAAMNPSALLAAELQPKKKKKAASSKKPKTKIAKSDKPKKAKAARKSTSKDGKVYVVATNEPVAVYKTEQQAQLRALQEKLARPAITCRIFEAPFMGK